MKVILFNGSRNEKGSTYTSLKIVADALVENGIEAEIFWVDGRALSGEMKELVDEALEKVQEADGIVLGSPVYYASPSGEMIAFLDRLYWEGEKHLRFKPAAAVTVARRAGTTATLDVLNKYITYAQQPVVTSRYWNMTHGSNGNDVLKDEEGVQIMKTIGRNMAWILKSIQAGKAAGVPSDIDAECHCLLAEKTLNSIDGILAAPGFKILDLDIAGHCLFQTRGNRAGISPGTVDHISVLLPDGDVEFRIQAGTDQHTDVVNIRIQHTYIIHGRDNHAGRKPCVGGRRTGCNRDNLKTAFRIFDHRHADIAVIIGGVELIGLIFIRCHIIAPLIAKACHNRGRS